MERRRARVISGIAAHGDALKEVAETHVAVIDAVGSMRWGAARSRSASRAPSPPKRSTTPAACEDDSASPTNSSMGGAGHNKKPSIPRSREGGPIPSESPGGGRRAATQPRRRRAPVTTYRIPTRPAQQRAGKIGRSNQRRRAADAPAARRRIASGAVTKGRRHRRSRRSPARASPGSARCRRCASWRAGRRGACG